MTLLQTLQDAIGEAKNVIINNLDVASEHTGDLNLYGDKTLLLDVKAEDAIISVLSSSDTNFEILTEEKGFIKNEKKPDYLALIDPIDGSTNLERGIPLVSIGISIIPYKDVMTSDEIEISVIESIFTHETYIAVTGNGVTRNGIEVRPAAPVDIKTTIVSFNLRKTWDSDYMNKSMRTISSFHDIRRTASPLLDLCWTASGAIDGMVDIRDMLPIIHLSGIHMVLESGGFVLDQNGNRFQSSIEPEKMINFVAASNEDLARDILVRFKGLPDCSRGEEA